MSWKLYESKLYESKLYELKLYEKQLHESKLYEMLLIPKGPPIWNEKCLDIYLFVVLCSLQIAYPFQQ